MLERGPREGRWEGDGRGEGGREGGKWQGAARAKCIHIAVMARWGERQ